MTDNTIRAYAAMQAGAALQPYQFDAGELQPHQVEVQVEYCGLCHSDVSVINNEWNSSVYPVVAGHEIIGTISRLGSEAKGLKLGQRVGIGWTAESCQHCDPCVSGNKCSVQVGQQQPSSVMQVALPTKFAQVGSGLFLYLKS
jgi:uncharacterized zinc-type alcohol dehydrogenase-like protein